MASLFKFFFRTSRPNPQPPIPDPFLIPRGHIPPSDSQRREREQPLRIIFDSHGATAKGHPSSGGVLVKSVNAVDLDYLGVSRVEETLRPTEESSSEEDAWCMKLRQLAPKWYPSMKYRDDAASSERPATRADTETVFVAYEDEADGGGVWVVRFVVWHRPEGWARYELCLDMRERCEALREFGAIRFQDADEVEELTERYDERRKRERDELEEKYGSFDEWP